VSEDFLSQFPVSVMSLKSLGTFKIYRLVSVKHNKGFILSKYWMTKVELLE